MSATLWKDHCRFIGGSDARIVMGGDETSFLRLWLEKSGDLEPNDPEDLNRRWYEAITSRIPTGLHIVAVCYVTAVILLGWLPWNVLLLLPLFLGKNGHLRFREFETRHGSFL
jgi:hypothetical protein